MPQVPGTKIWIRKGELEDAIDRMEMCNPLERMSIASRLAEVVLTRSKQARSHYSKVYSFIVRSWFMSNDEQIKVIGRTANAR